MKTDVHNHAIPQSTIDLVNAESVYEATVKDRVMTSGVHVPFPLEDSFVEVEAKLAELEANGLDGAVISVSPTVFYYHVDAAAGEEISRASNAGLADMSAAAPDRIHWMATVPLQDPDRAVAVLEDAAKDGAVGVEIGTAAGPEKRLDHPDLEPFWAAAERLGTPVMLHPAYTVANPSLGDFYLENVIGFPLETTVAIERLICAGTLDRFPDVKVVLLHAGGYFPWQGGRLRHARTRRPELAQSPVNPFDYFGQVVVDTITHDPDALRYLIAKAGVENVVMGTDLPFDMAPPSPVEALREVCDDETVEAISERNPARLYRLG